MTSVIGMIIFFTLQTACSAVYAHTGNKSAAHAVIAFIFLFYGSYDLAFTPLIVSYTVEILPYQIRAKGFTVFNFSISLSLIFNQYVNPVALGSSRSTRVSHIPFVLTYIFRCHRLEILPRLCHLAVLRGCLPLVLCVYVECLLFLLVNPPQQLSSRLRTAPSKRPQPCSTETKPLRKFKLLPMPGSSKMKIWTRNRLVPTTIKRSKHDHSPWFLFSGSSGFSSLSFENPPFALYHVDTCTICLRFALALVIVHILFTSPPCHVSQ